MIINFEKDCFPTKYHYESWLEDLYPLTIISDRYGGTYSGGVYTAWPLCFNEIPEDIEDSDVPCFCFWEHVDKSFIGMGATIEEAKMDLIAKLKAKLEEYDTKRKSNKTP